MSGCTLIVMVAALCACLLTSSCSAKAVVAPDTETRNKREVSSWDLVSPYLVEQQCFARPCVSDEDCCPGYACTGLRDITRRAVPLRSCALSLEEMEDWF